jgi:hypothetical protein
MFSGLALALRALITAIGSYVQMIMENNAEMICTVNIQILRKTINTYLEREHGLLQ